MRLWEILAVLVVPCCALRLGTDGWRDGYHLRRGHRLVMFDLGRTKLCLDCGNELGRLRWPEPILV